MNHYAPIPRMPSATTDQPGIEVMAEVPGTSRYDVSANPRYLSARKPVPIYSSDPALAYSDNVIQPHSSPLQRLKAIFLGSGNTTVPFVIGFLCSTVIFGAVLGGGLGSPLASCQRSVKSLEASITSVPASATRTSTAPIASNTTNVLLQNYRAADHDDVDTLYNTCTQATVVNTWGDTYIPFCAQDFNNGFPAAEGGICTDLAALIAYSFDDCMDMCSGFNSKAVENGFPLRCRSITFIVSMKNSTAWQRSNCWLKNGTLRDVNRAYANGNAMSAKLGYNV